MTILQGTMQDGTVLPVQVDSQGRLVAEGLPGPAGPAGSAGPAGPAGPAGVSDFSKNGTDLYYLGGRLGLGTSSPAERLHVVDSAATVRIDSSAGNDIQVRFQQGSTFIGAVGYDASEDCVYLNRFGDATKGLVVNSSNNVGIGLTNPQVDLHVAGVGAMLELRLQSPNGQWWRILVSNTGTLTVVSA